MQRRAPAAPWGRIWALVLAVTLLGGLGLERFVRARGYEPSIKDDAWAWAWERGRIDGDPHAVAILGGSRILLAFDAATFRRELPGYTPVQLAVNGTQPIGTLRALAADPDFRGVVIVDTSELGFLHQNWATQDAELDAYRRGWARAPGAMAERYLATLVQSHVALVTAGGPRLLEGLLLQGQWPGPRYVVTHADRTRYADYDLADASKLRRAHEIVFHPEEITAAEELEMRLAEALETEPAIRAIQARGGKVVYLRMPTCGARWLADEAARPKAAFWDRLAARTAAAAAIHFKDHEALSHFDCPDLSHLDSRDGPAFTRGLVEVLVARGVVAR